MTDQTPAPKSKFEVTVYYTDSRTYTVHARDQQEAVEKATKSANSWAEGRGVDMSGTL